MHSYKKTIRLVEGYQSLRKPPKNVTREDEWLFSRDLQSSIPTSFAVKIRDVRIFRTTLTHIFGLGLGPTFSRSAAAGRKAKLLLNGSSLFAQLPGAQKIERGTWVVDDWSAGYFHWLTDVLSRIELGLESLSEYPILLPSSFSNISFIADTIAVLNIPVIYISPSSRYKVRELVLTSYAAPTGNYNERILHNIVGRLQDSLLRVKGGCYPSIKKRRVYVSRAKSYRRKVSNESELIPLLKDFGFDIVYPEDVCFMDQVLLFSSASILVGLHGAGLTNMLFMKPGGVILELRRTGDNHNNCYFSLASAMSLDYFYLTVQSAGENLFEDNCYVEPQRLKDLLCEIC